MPKQRTISQATPLSRAHQQNQSAALAFELQGGTDGTRGDGSASSPSPTKECVAFCIVLGRYNMRVLRVGSVAGSEGRFIINVEINQDQTAIYEGSTNGLCLFHTLAREASQHTYRICFRLTELKSMQID